MIQCTVWQKVILKQFNGNISIEKVRYVRKLKLFSNLSNRGRRSAKIFNPKIMIPNLGLGHVSIDIETIQIDTDQSNRAV